MIRIIKAYEECRDFVSGFIGDPRFSAPMLSNEEQVQYNLIKAIERPDSHCVLGVYCEEQMIGLFVFLVLREEKYVEMLAGLSREKDAYPEVLHYLEQHFPGFSADFVFNPDNDLLKELLEQRKAEFEPEQQKMVLGTPVPGLDTTGVELLSEKYTRQYCAIHNQDMYWTGEKVAEAQDRFRTLLAIHEGKVVGYVDVTCTYNENEPYDLLVLEEYRRMGYGRKLLAKALEMNQPNGMMLLVDADNVPAISLYESMGFVKVQGQNNLTVHWTVPEHERCGNAAPVTKK
ncbi:MAG: GNAT family N-acetyltransferase [Clostridia bacterium]|nr:GNAT family N-acetyltransferase [Clostridia bacterium]